MGADLLNLRKKFDGRIGGNGTVGRGGDELAEVFGTTVAGGEEPSEISRTGIVGNNETRLVEEEETFEIATLKNFSKGRKAANFNEEAGNGKDLLIF